MREQGGKGEESWEEKMQIERGYPRRASSAADRLKVENKNGYLHFTRSGNSKNASGCRPKGGGNSKGGGAPVFNSPPRSRETGLSRKTDKDVRPMTPRVVCFSTNPWGGGKEGRQRATRLQGSGGGAHLRSAVLGGEMIQGRALRISLKGTQVGILKKKKEWGGPKRAILFGPSAKALT